MLLRLISWPYLKRHVTRTALTVAGIVLGVAVFVGMHTANRSVIAGFGRTVDQIAGATELQITLGDAGFPESVLERVQAVSEVRVAVPVIEATVDTGLPGEGNLLILAVDMTGDRALRDYDFDEADAAIIDDPLVFLAQPDSLMITSEFASRNHLAAQDRLTFATVEGPRTFVIRGVMKSGGLTSAFGGNVGVMDVFAAQQVFGRGRSFDRIDVVLRDDVTVDSGRRAIVEAIGPSFDVAPPASRGQQIESTLRVYTTTVNISSVFALFIGMFIIYNAFAIAVAQRRTEIGILRALGATRGQIRTLFMVESALGGVVGSVVGIAVGLAMARAMAGNISAMLEGVYGFARQPERVDTAPGVLLLAALLGLLTSVVAAFVPARNASRVDPVQALQKGRSLALSAGENRARRWLALTCASLAGAIFVGGAVGPVFYLGYALVIVSALFLAPSLCVWLTTALRPALRGLRPVEGALAADSLLQAPRRTSATVAAVMLSLAQVIGLGGISRASYASILDWVDTALNPDLFVTGSQNIADRTFRFPAAMGDAIAALPGIAAVERVRSARITYHGDPAVVVSVEVGDVAVRAPRVPVEGRADEMYAKAAAGTGVMVSENFAANYGVHLGSMLDLPTPSGVQRLPVVGVVVDWSDQIGTIILDRSVYVRYWQDESVNIFRVYLEAGADEGRVRAALKERFAGDRAIVLTNGELRRYIMRLTDQWIGLTYVQLAVAMLVAILGIVNTLTVSIIDRRRELGVLQAVGARRSQIRRTIWLEALTIAFIGVVLGTALGAVNLAYVLEVTHRDIGGMRLPYDFPLPLAVALLPTMLAAAFVAAWGPSEAAVRSSLVEALEYE
ncbi:MAG: FtsX-like permease family protein [Vicinamibacterales bacterium]